jgi:hypothetical protein
MKKNTWLFLLWWLISLVFAGNYFILMRTGEPSQKNTIIFAIWLVLSVVGLALFIREISRKNLS